jgi:hypothetical protein
MAQLRRGQDEHLLEQAIYDPDQASRSQAPLWIMPCRELAIRRSICHTLHD